MFLHSIGERSQFNSGPTQHQQRRWWGPRRYRCRRPEYLLEKVVPEWTRGSWRNHVGTVQGQSPSERSFGIRSRRSYSSGRLPSNVSFGKSFGTWSSTKKNFPSHPSSNQLLFWLSRRRVKTSWYACSHKSTTSRFVGNLWRFNINMLNCGNVYLDMINKSYFLVDFNTCTCNVFGLHMNK